MLLAKTKQAYFYYAIYILIAWSIAVYFLPASETVRSLAKFIVWGVPLAFMYRNSKFRVFKEANKPLDFKVITKYITFTLLALVAYSLVINRFLNHSISISISVWFVLNAVIFAPTIEEIVFRGYFLQKLQNNFVFWKANIIQAFLFMLVHFPQWIARGASITVFSCCWILSFGILLGFVKRKTNWLWATIIIHSVGNIILKIFLS